jgi:hypothetical protein
MASRNKKTTFAKMNREQNQRERRIEKKARKDARKLAAATEADQVLGGDQATEEPQGEQQDEAGSPASSED